MDAAQRLEQRIGWRRVRDAIASAGARMNGRTAGENCARFGNTSARSLIARPYQSATVAAY